MKKVVKVSIGNLAFTIEEEGYLILKGYLDELHEHYDNKENGAEIIEGIEERMAELFIEKCGRNNVVTTANIRDVITVLGRPEVIDEEHPEGAASSSSRVKPPKRLYRNPDNKVLGGVCSGLAAYFKLDTTLVRILFVILFIGFSFFGMFHVGGGGFMLFAYILLWILVPEARTVEQRCAMYGETMDLADLQKRMERGVRHAERRIRRVGREGAEALGGIALIISRIVAAFLVIISMSGLIVLSFLFLGIEIFKGVIPLDVLDYIAIGLDNPIYFKIAFLGIIFLPLLGMLYGGIQLLFGFRTPGIRPGLIIFILWIVSMISFGILATQASRPYWSNARSEGEYIIESQHDTLFIKFDAGTPLPDTRVMLDAGYSSYLIFWMEGERKQEQIVAFPPVKIVRQASTQSVRIKYRTLANSYTYSEALLKSRNNLPEFEVNDSLIIVKPDIFSREAKWDATIKELFLYVPQGVTVIVKEPVEHDFESHIKREWFFNCNPDRFSERWEDRMDNLEYKLEKKRRRVEKRINR